MNHNRNLNNEETWDVISYSFNKTRIKPWDICDNFMKSLKLSDIVLDLGCGNGRNLIPYNKLIKKGIGLDLSKNLLDIFNKKINDNKIKKFDLIHSNITDLPFKDNTIDTIIYIAALHNINYRHNRIKSLYEIKRVLKNDGKALISVWSRWQDKYFKYFLKKMFLTKDKIIKNKFGDVIIPWKKDGLNVSRYYHLYSKYEFINDIKRAGLKISSIQGVKIISKNNLDNYFAIVKK